MSVVGIDFGNLQSVVAVARNRGIDIVCNEVSNRSTPSLVSFGYRERYLGETAKTQEISNFKNTVSSLKRLAGRSFQDPEIQKFEKRFINAQLADVDGQVGVRVNYLGEPATFSNIQLMAMYLTKLKHTTSAELRIPVSDCVISVPGWFTDAQRRAILDAANIAGLNPLRLINDTTAAALGYGITKTDLPEEKPLHVLFCDIGHSSYSVAVVAFLKGQLTVKGTAYDRHFGGRNFDEILVSRLAEQIKEKQRIDVYSNNKAIFRLRNAAEKIKKVLSANPQAPFNVESILNDRDFSTILSRQELEEWSQELLDRVEVPLEQALQASGLTKADIDSIEIIGGSTRIPAIKKRISKFFGKDISATTNQDEAVARGAALQCAILSPVFKVRPFHVHDLTTAPIKVVWQPTPEEEETEIVVFNKNNSIPSTKILTFHRREPFDLEVYYADPTTIPAGVSPWIGRFTIKNVEPQANGEPAQVKVKVRLNIHGVVSLESAYVVEERIEERVEEPKTDETQPMDTDEKNGKPPAAPVKRVKKLVKKGELPVVGGTMALDRSMINKYREAESQMAAADKLIADTQEKRNSLEEYVYDTRSKLSGYYAPFAEPAVKDNFINLLNDTEDWLYGDGEDATKSVYIAKLDELKKVGDPIAERYKESEERPRAARLLRETVQLYTANALSTDERFAHIPAEEKQQVVDKCEAARKWLDGVLAKQAGLAKYASLVVTAKNILKEREQLVLFASPILTKPKPAPKPAESPKPETETPPPAKEETKDEQKNDMDID